MQAMGRGDEFSSADDTDTDAEDTKLDERVKMDVEAGAIAERLENVYWGDSENDVKISKTNDKELDKYYGNKMTKYLIYYKEFKMSKLKDNIVIQPFCKKSPKLNVFSH